MQAAKQALISFFEQIAQKDEVQLKIIKQEKCFQVEQAHWRFTLPDLFVFLQHQNDIFSSIDYKQFRQLIFNSPINRAVKLYGAEITISENRAKVDKSIYALIWPTEELNPTLDTSSKSKLS